MPEGWRSAKKGEPAIEKVRHARLYEGTSTRVHHETYLSDPRRAATVELRTVPRKPVRLAG